MTCWTARRRSSAYLDRTLREGELSRLKAHLRQCADCTARFEQLTLLRTGLRELPRRVSPDDLKTKLLVAASRERQALLQSGSSRLMRTLEYWRFRLDELMRPLTIPASGGLLASMLLFGVLSFAIGNTTRGVSYEVPVMYADSMGANLLPVQLRSAVVMKMSLDTHGHIVDYAVQDGACSFTGDVTRLQSNSISLPEFPGVLALASPISRDISISFTPLVYRQ
jgi:hypothetical protein